jgi:dynein heavy chain 2
VIASAEGLIGKLDGERVRWAEQVKAIKDQISFLPIRCLLAGGFISYLGGATETVRENVTKQWLSAVGVGNVGFDFLAFMSTESEQLTWKAENLPSDRLSLENAVIMTQSQQSSLLLDPGLRATEWLKQHMKDKRLEVCNQQDSNFVTTLELALRFGKTLLIQEVDNIEPLLFPVLRRELIAQGPRFCVLVGEKLVDYNEDFKLFLSTRNSAIEISPNASAIVTSVTFTTTRAGLANQLLARTIQNEKPELEVLRLLNHC